VRLAGLETETVLEELAGPLEAMTAELPGELLEAVADEQAADEDA
jgi:hypothetical protein